MPKHKIRSSDVNLPLLYIEAYYAWYCESRRCMVFRKNKFENIFEIGLIIHFKDTK